VAVKQMHPGLAEQPAYVAMFVEEARLGAALESPNLAEVRDFIADRGNYYMVLEWVEGVDLGTWTRWHFERGEGPRWELVAAIGVGVLRGLAAGHERVDANGRRRWSTATSARTTSCHHPRHGEGDRLRPGAGRRPHGSRPPSPAS
jgi:hypothetical protein